MSAGPVARLLARLRDMRVSLTLAANSIGNRLWAGFGLVVLLLIGAGVTGQRALQTMDELTHQTLDEVQREAALSARLSASVAQEIEAAGRYLDGRDPGALEAFRRLGWEAHRVQRELSAQPGQRPDEVALVATVDELLAGMEVRYARAHRLSDLGRMPEARLEAARARGITEELLATMGRLGQLKTRQVAEAADRLSVTAAVQSRWLLAFVAVAFLAAAVAVLATINPIRRPLRELVRHAQELSAGNLTVRTTSRMPSEFQVLAAALNRTGESLSKIVTVVAATADDVAGSAEDLASVSEQISTAAGQMASSMSEVSTGAEGQVRQLRAIDQTLRTMREGAAGVRAGAEEVNALAQEIEESARAKRAEIDRALGILFDVKAQVQRAATEVTALNTTTEDINKFVNSVSRIAEQTNLLALNAAIEAARAGQAGRGFAVVADEVRKLAEQAQGAADDIVRMTGVVTARVASTTQAMESGARRVGEIEGVSRDIDQALTTISAAAERTRRAATTVAAAAEDNARSVTTAAGGIVAIANTAEGHAATAQEVSASTEEQSAACEQMNSASAQLQEGSALLRELVKGLRTEG